MNKSDGILTHIIQKLSHDSASLDMIKHLQELVKAVQDETIQQEWEMVESVLLWGPQVGLYGRQGFKDRPNRFNVSEVMGESYEPATSAREALLNALRKIKSEYTRHLYEKEEEKKDE